MRKLNLSSVFLTNYRSKTVNLTRCNLNRVVFLILSDVFIYWSLLGI